jgi:hypothetical protein
MTILIKMREHSGRRPGSRSISALALSLPMLILVCLISSGVYAKGEGVLSESKQIQWEEKAQKRLKKVPFFVRSFARSKVEKAAREEGLEVITEAFMEKIKKQEMGR